MREMGTLHTPHSTLHTPHSTPLGPMTTPPPLPFDVTMTLGPATDSDSLIERLMATADRFRLNGSHLTPDELEGWLKRLAAIFERVGRVIPVVVDLQGAKMRIGRYPEVSSLPARVSVRLGEVSDTPEVIPVPHAELFAVAVPGERLLLNDAQVELLVTAVSDGSMEADVTRDGPLSSRKGINRPDHPLPFDALLPRDAAQVAVARRFPFVRFAYSFVHTGREAAMLREAAPGAHLIAKIERPEAMEHLAAVDAAFDETWFCRGDLGAQAGIERLGVLQARYADAIGVALHKPAILAGQVLHHMSDHPTPTRSEVVHLYDTRRLGWAGIVLSDETAVGANPELVADVLDRLLGRP